MSSTVSLFVDFRVGNSNAKVRFDIVMRSNHAHQYDANLES